MAVVSATANATEALGVNLSALWDWHRQALATSMNAPMTLNWEFPKLVVLNLTVCNFYAEALFCARSFALFCGLAFALICALLRSFARFCVRPPLEGLRLGISD